jgi:formamidopyrimidine-DNA glycosylase
VPELPDIAVYVEHVAQRTVGQVLQRIQLLSPFVLRTVDPPPGELEGRVVVGVRRLGKRIVLACEGERFAVIHLMIAGRLQWYPLLVADAAAAAPAGGGGPRRAAKPPAPPKLHPRRHLLALHFAPGLLTLTEAGSKRRASLHLVRGESGLAELDPGGAELAELDAAGFAVRLRAGNHTLKRALTDPRIFSGIGNAYSDEILFRAQLSPVTLTGKLDDAAVARLWAATREVLAEWTARLRDAAGAEFPREVTAFHPEMAVHGRYGQPCVRCGGPVQKIAYADKETNYCPTCQTGGRLLADRGLSRLLKRDWPKTLDELEAYKQARRAP